MRASKPRLKPTIPTGDADVWWLNGQKITVSGFLILVYGKWHALKLAIEERLGRRAD